MFESQFYSNYAERLGGSICAAHNASLLIHGTYFENNTAGSVGGVLYIFNQSFVTINKSSLVSNRVLDDGDSRGGGLHAERNCTVIISNVHFTESKARQGAAIFISDFSQITMFNSTLMANRLQTMVLLNSASSISDCRFFNNWAPLTVSSASSLNVTNTVFSYNAGHNGGVLYAEILSYVSFYNCSFADNTAFEGGAVFIDNSNVHLIASNFTGNNANNGGVFHMSGYLFIAHCIMNNNTAYGDGGVGYLDENSQINITRSIFKKNSALNVGGVLQIRKSTVIIWNSSFVQNGAGFIGGVVNAEYNTKINVTQTTFYGNKGHHGGVLYAKGNTTLFVLNSKIVQNSAFTCAAAMIYGASVLEISLSDAHKNIANHSDYALCAFNNSVFIFKSSSFTGKYSF